MTKEAKNRIENLTENQKWLFQHVITAFWHEFGLSGGLTVYKAEWKKPTGKQ